MSIRFQSFGLLGALSLGAAACSTAAAATTPPRPVVAASPPQDDGKTAQASGGGDEHSARLEELRLAPTRPAVDKQNSVVIPLPDAEHWLRVRIMTVKTLVAFRYGKEHHAVVAGLVTHVDDNSVPGACAKSFETWAKPWIEAFEIDIAHDSPSAFPWSPPPATPQEPRAIAIVDVDPLKATTATLLSHDSWMAAWTSLPAWRGACLVVGVGVPIHGDETRAREVRDRFVKDVFPKITVTALVEPPERY